MDRQEHLEWCKKRALDYIEDKTPMHMMAEVHSPPVSSDAIQNAFASFQSDMSKHPETANHLALEMGTMLLISGNLSSVNQMVDWIKGFN